MLTSDGDSVKNVAYTRGLAVFTTPETMVTSFEIAIATIHRANEEFAIGMSEL